MCNPSHPADPKKSPGAPAGDAPLLWLPGTLCDARVFAPMRALLAGQMPGRVHRDIAITGHDSVGALAAAILDQVPSRFIAVGFSLGAIAALALAARAPDRIAGLALIAANARDVPPDRHAERRALEHTPPGELVGTTLWPASVAPARQGDAALRAAIVAMALAAPPGTLARQTELALTRPDSRPLLPRLAMPVLVIGGAEDRVAPPELQHEIAAACPAGRLHIVPGAGHFVPLEDPAACATALAAWLGPVDPDPTFPA